MSRLPKIYCCKDCGNMIHYTTAFYEQGRCKSCCRIGNLNPRFTTGITSKLCFCIDCHKSISRSRIRCVLCSKIGKLNPNYKSGFPNCLDCGKQLTGRRNKRCFECHWNFAKGTNNPNYLHGNGYGDYPDNFNQKLRNQIRERDNHICSHCYMTEKQHQQKYQRNLHIHHIDYNKQNCAPKNLITLCQLCNVRANFERDYWFAYYTYQIEKLYAN